MHARDATGLQRASASSIDSAGGLAHHEVHPAADYDPLTTGELGDAEPETEESEVSRPAVDKAALQQHLSLEAARWGQRMTSELDNALSMAGEAGVACRVQQCKWGGLQFCWCNGAACCVVSLWRCCNEDLDLGEMSNTRGRSVAASDWSVMQLEGASD